MLNWLEFNEKIKHYNDNQVYRILDHIQKNPGRYKKEYFNHDGKQYPGFRYGGSDVSWKKCYMADGKFFVITQARRISATGTSNPDKGAQKLTSHVTDDVSKKFIDFFTNFS